MNGNLLNRVPALLSFVILLTCFGVKCVSAQSITSSSPQTQVNLSPNQIDISAAESDRAATCSIALANLA